MKKFVIVTLSVLAFTNVALARTPQEMCDKYNATAQRQIERVENYKTYSEKMKAVKKKAIQAQADIKCELAKDLLEAREEAKAERAEARKAKKNKKPKQEA